ncbi:MAG: sigma-70 family RNA polymerase sigma factor, partial [Actinomycetota bacterium]|nr:sigma-70 family RNA polymerase sigma factor [Actinomycetota bacterium]
ELQSAGTLEAYVRRSVVNSTISRWRRFRRREDPESELAQMRDRDVQPDVAAALSDADLAWQLCQQLRPQQRAAVVLRFYEDLSFAEIGKVLGCPESTARSHVHRALASLRTLLERGDPHG